MQSDCPLISVIVPIYKIERYIGICIESIINQTYRNLEIILVDDGSPDRCPEICDLYAQKDSRIKVIHKKNGGLVSARKAGIIAATGEYIGYVDGDDWVGAGFYESLVSAMKASNADMVCAGQSRDLFEKSFRFCDNVTSGLYEGEKLKKLQTEMMSFGAYHQLGISTYVWNKLFRREVLLQNQLNVDERISIGEDAAVTYPVLMDCKRVYVTDNCAYHYRQREDSMLKSTTSFRDEQMKLRYLYEYLSAFAAKLPEEFAIQKQADDFVLSICIIRSGGILPNHSYSAFNENFLDKKVVVYSAGTFGQQLVKRFSEQEHCEVVGWLDEDYWEYRRCCMNVDAVESVSALTYDYVLIATVIPTVAEKMKNRLLDCGVSAKKILTVHHNRADSSRLIQQYLGGSTHA